MIYSSPYRSRRGLIVGLVIVAVGIVLFLDQQGILSAGYVFRFFWPGVFIFFGLESLISCRGKGGRGLVGLVLFAFGVLLLMGALGILHVGISTLWPLVLIIWGIWVIARAFGPESELSAKIKDAIHEKINDGVASGQPGDKWENKVRSAIYEAVDSWRGTESKDAEFDHMAIFAGIKQRVAVKNFRGGRLMALCGGFEIDLTRADIDGQSAVIDASALMGGGEIRVPVNWIVEVRGIALLGGYTDETHQEIADPTTAKHLIVKGMAVLGGVVIKN